MGASFCNCLKRNVDQVDSEKDEAKEGLICKVGPTGKGIRVLQDRFSAEISGQGTALGSFPLECDTGRWLPPYVCVL